MLSRMSVVVVLTLLFSGPAAAIPIDPPHLMVDVLFNRSTPDRISTNRFGTTSLGVPGLGVASVTASGTPSPSLVADADSGPNSEIPALFGRGSGSLTYGVEIGGPAGAVPVLIDVAGSASASSSSGASFAVESSWAFRDVGSLLAGDEIRSGQLSGSFNQNFGRTVSLTLAVNHVYTVDMLADAAAAATLEGSSAIAHAVVDPVFSFGPGIDPLLYSFHLSDGIGNAGPTTVPEPGTAALVSSVLLVLPFRRRLRLCSSKI